MDKRATDPSPSSIKSSPEGRLDSWKEIAAYLRRDVRTVQRWEKDQGLPVRRLKIGKQGQVYAYGSELDKWILERQPDAEEEDAGRVESLWKWVLAGIGLIAAGFALHALWPKPQALPEKTLLFVRPFKNQSDDPNQKEFVSGLTYEMITQFGKLNPKRLGVFAPTTSEALEGKSIDDLKKQLKADYVLEGSVRRANNRLRIDATLVSTEDQMPKWANSYTGDVRDSLKFQDEVTADVAKQIGIALPPPTSGGRDSGKREVDPAVYEAYLEGRLHWLDRDFPLSLASYQRALEKDSDYAPALAGVAGAYLLLGQSPRDVWRPEVAMEKAREAAQLALSRDPTLADAYCVLANISMSYDHNMGEAERLYKHALELDPSSATAQNWYGDYLIASNRLDEAEKQKERARELDPASPLFNTDRAEVYYFQRKYDAVIKQASQTLDQHPNFMFARLWLASAYREKRMYREAIEQFDLLRHQSNNLPVMLMLYGHVRGLSGDQEAARDALRQLQSASQTRYVPAIYFAAVYTGLGDHNQAFKWLDKSYEERNDRLIYLGVDPIADPLRSDPRFRDLLRRIGLPP